MLKRSLARLRFTRKLVYFTLLSLILGFGAYWQVAAHTDWRETVLKQFWPASAIANSSKNISRKLSQLSGSKAPVTRTALVQSCPTGLTVTNGNTGTWVNTSGATVNIRIAAVGAGGGKNTTTEAPMSQTSFNGGGGASIAGEFTVAPGESILLIAGAPGANSDQGGSGGGGSGAVNCGNPSNCGSGTILLIAGGGGGTSGYVSGGGGRATSSTGAGGTNNGFNAAGGGGLNSAGQDGVVVNPNALLYTTAKGGGQVSKTGLSNGGAAGINNGSNFGAAGGNGMGGGGGTDGGGFASGGGGQTGGNGENITGGNNGGYSLPGGTNQTNTAGANGSGPNQGSVTLTCLGVVAPPSAPEIEVSETTAGNIADGGSFSFGSTLVGTPVTKTFTVSNSGSGNLTLSNLAVPTGFAITSNFGTTTVTPGNSTTFQITMSAAAGTTPNGSLSFTNNDADENPFNFTLSGTVIAPPRVVKSFPVSNTVVVGEMGFIGFEIFNDNSTVALNGIGFTDSFPAGIMVADDAGIVDDGGTYTVLNNVLTVSGASVPAGETRTFTLNFTAVQAQATPYTNTIASVSSTNGGTNNTASNTQITVNKANTTTTVTNASSLASTATVVGQSYLVNIDVATVNPNSLTRLPQNAQRRRVAMSLATTDLTGTVTVSDGSATCTITLPSASCSLTSTTAGAKSITATYNGDSNYNTSTSSGAPHTVNKADTAITITNAPSLGSTPTVVGQSYAVNWSVVVNSPGTGTPGGNVTIDAGGGNTCTAAASAGTCNITSTTAGAKTITASYAGDSNFNSSNAVNALHTVNPADTTTTITNTVALGTATIIGEAYAVNWSVTVNSPGAVGAALTGNVTVSDGSQTCTAPVSAGTCNLTSTTLGTKNITASYAGDTNYNSSMSAGVSHTVSKPATTTTITNAATLLSTPTVVGETYNVSVSVTVNAPGMGTPTGTVSVNDGTGATCSITLPATSCQLTSVTVGAPKTITAIYTGDTDFNTSTSAGAPHTVNQANTTTIITNAATLTSTATVVGQSYTVSVSVAGVVPSPLFAPTNGREFVKLAPPPTSTPTGSVTVSDGSATCSITLPATSCNLTSTTAGTKSITATYNGDSNYLTSVSSGASHTVNKADTTTTITADTPDPSVIGQSYAVTASVSVTAPGAGTPTGTISVSDGASSCTITLPATSCNLPSNSPGAKTLTATYNGDSNFNSSSPSAGVQHTVNKADVTVNITSDTPDPSPSNQNVTVNFTVAAAAPGAGTPTGNVTISDGVDSCTATVAAGSCALTLSTVGSRTLTASYEGDANFNSGTDTEPHTVTLPPTIAKVFNPSTTPVNGTTTLTITITNPAANTVALTGVGFTDTFPAGLVIAATPNLTNTCGGTLTNLANGAVSAGDNGLKLSGGTIGTAPPRTCAISVNVTPTVQGPLVNTINSVSSTEGGANNTPATATLITNLPPVVTVVPVTRAAGSITSTLLLANVSDDMTPVTALTATVNNAASATVNGVTLSGLVVNAGGQLQGQVLAACNATDASFTLNVTDSTNATTNATLNVTVPANPGPMLNYAAPPALSAGQTLNVAPATGPSDNGNVASSVVLGVTPAFGGTVAVNPVSGLVTVSNATPIGSYNVVIRATDQCGVFTDAAFTFNVTCPTISLNPGSLPGGQAGVAYSQTLTASPAGGGYSFGVTGGSLPNGLTLAANGALTGTPTTPGTFNFTVTATGFGTCTASQSYTVAITCPTVSLTSLAGGTAGVAYHQSVSASPAGGNYSFAVTGGSLPPGLTLAANGALTGTPTTGGTFNFTVTATGFGTCTGSQSYSLVIACPTLSLSPASLPNGTGGTAYSANLSATPSGTSYSFAVTSGTLPPGLTLASGGALSGTPSQAGTFTFTVTATGFGTCTGTKVYTVTITCPTLTLSAPPLPNGTVGTAYNQSVTAQPSGPTYSYALTSGTLPTGVSLNAATGALTGTPTTGGTYTFTVTATGFNSCTGSQSYTVTVACPTITLNPSSLPGTTAGVAYSQALTVTPTGTYSFSLTAGNLPPGLSLNTTTGALTGTPTATGTYNFTVKVATGSCFGTRAYTLVVTCPTITLNPASLPNGTLGTAYNQTLTATPSGNYTFTRTGGTLPPGLNLNTAGALTGTPTAAGTYTFTVRAQGFGTCPGTRSYTVTVTASCPTITLPASLPNGTLGLNYYGDLGGTTPSGNYSYTLTSGALPPGLTLDNLFGALLGTPTATGTFNFTLQARTSAGCSGTRAFTVVIGSSAAALNDFDGDRKSDLVTRNAETGAWTITLSATGKAETYLLGVTTDQPALGDYDGDRRTDLAVFRTTSATLVLRLSGSGLVFEQSLPELTNVPALQPVPADYDGDGRSDVAFWEASAGVWQIQSSASGKLTSYHFGASGSLAIPADYDGDGRADRAVYQPTTGVWQVEQSRDGVIVEQQFGLAKDLPLPGDFDGDGRAEFAVWRASEATLYIYRQATPLQLTKLLIGLASTGDWLLAGDYNGDGKLDLAIWRALEGKWYFTNQRAAGATANGQQ